MLELFYKLKKNQRGSMSIEYIAIGVLALAVMTGIITYIKSGGNADGLGETFLSKISDVIDNVKVGE